MFPGPTIVGAEIFNETKSRLMKHKRLALNFVSESIRLSLRDVVGFDYVNEGYFKRMWPQILIDDFLCGALTDRMFGCDCSETYSQSGFCNSSVDDDKNFERTFPAQNWLSMKMVMDRLRDCTSTSGF